MSDEKEQLKLSDENAEQMRLYLLALSARGITEVEVSFSGSGDEGNIDGITFRNATEDKIKVEFSGDQSEEDFEQLVDDILYNDCDYDWYNNDGGFGTLKIDVEKKKLDLDMNINEVNANEYPMEAQL